MRINTDCSAFYPALEPYYNTGEYPFIRVGDVKDIVNYDDCIKIPEEILPDYPTLKKVDIGDIVLTKGGSIGIAGYITQPACVSRDLIFINSSVLSESNRILLYLYLSTKFAYKQFIRSSSQCAQPHLTTTLIKNFDIYSFTDEFADVVLNKYTAFREKLVLSKHKYQQAEEILLEELGLKDWEPTNQASTTKSFTDFLGNGRLDAEYYQPKYDEIEAKIKAYKNGYTQIKQWFEILGGGSPSEYTNEGIGVIKTKNVRIPVVDYDSINDCTTDKCLKVKQHDLLFASMGVGSLGRVSYIENETFNYTVDGTIKILRSKTPNNNIEIPTLLFLTSKYGQELIYKYVIGSTGIISISKDNIDNLIIPIIDSAVAKTITDMVLESTRLKNESKRLLDLAKTAVETAIEQGEEKAIELLKQ